MKLSLLGFLGILFCNSLAAQIVASGNTGSSETSYPEYATQHPVYLFNDIASGSISANPATEPTVPDYSWYAYNSGNWTYIDDTKTPQYSRRLTEGAYRVDIKDNGVVEETQYCWVFQPEIISVDIDTVSTSCSEIELNTEVDSKDLEYFDLSSGALLLLDYQYEYHWESSDEESDAATASGAIVQLLAPYDNETYTLTVNAFNGASEYTSNTLSLDGIAVDASYTATVNDRGNENEISENSQYSAPVDVSFEDTSLGNITDREWVFYNSEGGEVSADQDVTTANYTFTNFDTYTAELMITNRNSGCRDSYVGEEINVIEMFMDMPNAFTPNGDGINDKFMVVYKSIKSFKMTIVNRSGRKVFETTNPGSAWDGTIGGKLAADGVYFYYIEAKGFNEGEVQKEYGPVHLISGK